MAVLIVLTWINIIIFQEHKMVSEKWNQSKNALAGGWSWFVNCINLDCPELLSPTTAVHNHVSTDFYRKQPFYWSKLFSLFQVNEDSVPSYPYNLGALLAVIPDVNEKQRQTAVQLEGRTSDN